MYRIETTNRFEKDIERCAKRGLKIELLKNVIKSLEKQGELSQSYKPHKLKGDYAGCWEAHVSPDWLVVWILNEPEKKITLTRTGAHSDLFK